MNEETRPRFAAKIKINIYNRRRFLQLATSTTVGGALLAACGGSTPQPLKTAPVATTLPQAQIDASATASVGKNYFPGGAPHVLDAYTAPPPAFQSVKWVPGSGKKVRAFEVFYATPSVPKSQNKYWQTLDKTLNVDWEVTQVVSDDYDTKGTVMLNSSSPAELMLIMDSDSVFRTAMQQGAFNDLTPFLSGNGLKEFPNLARIAPSIWENSKYQGKIYGVPRSRAELGNVDSNNVLMYRKDWADKLGLGVPQNPDEFYKMMVTFSKSDPTGKGTKVWGFGGRAYFGNNAYLLALFGCPNNWRVESNGSFTYFIETDEFKQALDFERRLWAAGVYHPDAPIANNKQSKTGFESGKYATYLDGFGATLNEQRRTTAVDPKAEVRLLVPYNNKGKVARRLGSGYLFMTGIPTQATTDPERIRELLRILDYLTAPVFSVENNFLTYGIDGWDSQVGAKGQRQLTDKGRNEVGELIGLASAPPVLYYPEDPHYVIPLQDDVRKSVQDAIPDPSWGLSSVTADKLTSSLQKTLTSGFQRIVRGQDPLSAVADVVKQWQAQGGTKIKQELAESYSKVHGK
jgi:putative aldouronate transport system substrate-binding protein